MNELTSRSNQWRNIRLLPISTFGCLGAAKRHLLELRRISIGFTHGSATMNTVDIFEFAPQLRYIHLRSQFTRSSFKAPWSQIAHCDFTGCSDAQIILDMLEIVPNAETCVFSPKTLNSDARSVRLPKLRSLTISPLDDPGRFIHALQLPALENLIIIMNSEIQWSGTRQFTAVLAQCTPRKLVWWGDSLDDSHMMHIFRVTPRLREPHLMHGAVRCMSKNFFAHLPPATTPPCQIQSRCCRPSSWTTNKGLTWWDVLMPSMLDFSRRPPAR